MCVSLVYGVLHPCLVSHVSPDTCERRVEDTPTSALGILESALSGLGYSVESISDSTTPRRRVEARPVQRGQRGGQQGL